MIGLAHHTIDPDVAFPAADDVPDDGELVPVLVPVPLVVLLELLELHPATPSAPAATATATSRHPPNQRLPR
ncbi:MAG: hypothetical protein JO244_09360 [Solirubrobacterales bacterium]|nr:hypothetical protein [Solirubrobacterales bacterium]